MIIKAFALLAIMALTSPALALTPPQATKAFTDTLSADERTALLPLDAPDRKQSRLTPGSRGGVMLRDMDGETRAAAYDVLRSVLSEKGLAIVKAVREREAELARLEGRPDYRDPDGYALAIYGEPGAGEWALRFEGHHLSINVALEGERIVSVMPFMIGANPRQGPEGDPLFPLLQSAQDSETFATELAKLFPSGAEVPRPEELDIDLSRLTGYGHPHLVVRGR